MTPYGATGEVDPMPPRPRVVTRFRSVVAISLLVIGQSVAGVVVIPAGWVPTVVHLAFGAVAIVAAYLAVLFIPEQAS